MDMQAAFVEELADLEDWALVERLLPEGWERQARELGALRRAKGFGDAQALLRTLLIHLAGGCSLKETATRAAEGNVAQVSSVAVWKRLRHSGEWFRWMTEALMRAWVERLPQEVVPRGHGVERIRRMRLVDASLISEPGDTGSDWRIHYAVDLRTLRCDFVEVTGVEGGESLKRFPLATGDVVFGDRIYATRAGLHYVVRQGADAVVRVTTLLPLKTASGKPFALLKKLRKLRCGQVGDWSCWIAPQEPGAAPFPVRVCALKKSRIAAQRSREKLRKTAARKGHHLRAKTVEGAGYVIVLTTLPAQVLSAEQVLEMYRGRWQIELVFKRLKSILGLGHLPKHDPEGARAWLHGKLFVAFLVEALLRAGESFFPWGYPLQAQRRVAA